MSNLKERIGFVHILCSCTLFLFSFVSSELVVNVKNKGGQTIVEKIAANTSAETVVLKFVASDGSHITQFIDYKSEVHIFRADILGEEDLGRTEAQTFCFISRFMRSDFISADAMSKLRQKNPSAIRTPEEERETLVHTLDLSITPSRAYVISPHIYDLCHDAKDGILGQESDLRTISKSLGKDYRTLISATTPNKPSSQQTKCRDVTSPTQLLTQSCLCRINVCVGWYPCGLKYCHGTDTSGRVVSYRCGIKTCKRCLAFHFVVKSKYHCLWDLE